MRSLAFLLVCIMAMAGLSAAEGEWHALFDGRTLAGWQANENPATWVVEDGAIVTKGRRSHLFYTGSVANHDFKNFEFSAEVMTTPGSNSGIYFHTKLAPDPWPVTGYECQVINSANDVPGKYVERKMTGSIYAIRNTWRAPVADNVWFEYRIKVSGQTIQTFVDGQLICQHTEVPNAWRATDKQGRRLSSGTFALQGHDPDSVVRYRNLRVRVLPADSPSLEAPMADRELDELITQFSDQNFALIDFGVVRASPPREGAQAETARKLGVTFGYEFPADALNVARAAARGSVLFINDAERAPAIEVLQAAKAQQVKIAFSSGGGTELDPERLKRRLRAMRAAGLEWRDLWLPQGN